MAEQDSPTLTQVLDLLSRNIRNGIHTVKPGIVTEYSSAPRPNATVQLGQKLKTRSRGEIGYEPIRSVPVLFPTFGVFTIRSPLKPGNGVLCLVCDRAFDEWILGGQPAAPKNGRVHDWQDILAVPFFNPTDREPKVGTVPDELYIGAGATTIKLNAKTGAVSVEGVTVNVKAATLATVEAARIELKAFAGLPGGPFNVVGVNAAGLATHQASNGGGPLVWVPNPAGQVVIP